MCRTCGILENEYRCLRCGACGVSRENFVHVDEQTRNRQIFGSDEEAKKQKDQHTPGEFERIYNIPNCPEKYILNDNEYFERYPYAMHLVSFLCAVCVLLLSAYLQS